MLHNFAVIIPAEPAVYLFLEELTGSAAAVKSAVGPLVAAVVSAAVRPGLRGPEAELSGRLVSDCSSALDCLEPAEL